MGREAADRPRQSQRRRGVDYTPRSHWGRGVAARPPSRWPWQVTTRRCCRCVPASRRWRRPSARHRARRPVRRQSRRSGEPPSPGPAARRSLPASASGAPPALKRGTGTSGVTGTSNTDAKRAENHTLHVLFTEKTTRSEKERHQTSQNHVASGRWAAYTQNGAARDELVVSAS